MKTDPRLAGDSDLDPVALIEQLREAERLLRDEGFASIADGVGQYLAAVDEGSGAASLDRCLGLRKRGGKSVSRAVALNQRDQLILQLWKSSVDWRDLPPSAAAYLMRISAERYERSRWRKEQHDVSGPFVEPSSTWWKILRSGAGLPDVKRMQQILVLAGRP
jgi:hypothetical protein